LTLEPKSHGEPLYEIDYQWRNARGLHCCQVKSTYGEFHATQIRRWTDSLADTGERYCSRTLVLLGTIVSSLRGLRRSGYGVIIEAKPLNLEGFRREANTLLATFLRNAELPEGDVVQREHILKHLELKLQERLLRSGTYSKQELVTMLAGWMSSAPLPRNRIYVHETICRMRLDRFLGRTRELKLLNKTWKAVCDKAPDRCRVLGFISIGGEGKTTLIARWLQQLGSSDFDHCEAVFVWSFYRAGSGPKAIGVAREFLSAALRFFGELFNDPKAVQEADSNSSLDLKGRHLAELICGHRCLLILDGLEPLQHAHYDLTSRVGRGEARQGIASLLNHLKYENRGLCILTSRFNIPSLNTRESAGVQLRKLAPLTAKDGVKYLKTFGLEGPEQEFNDLFAAVTGHALALTIMGSFLKAHGGAVRWWRSVDFTKGAHGQHAFRAMEAYQRWLLSEGGMMGRRKVSVLRMLALFDGEAAAELLYTLRNSDDIEFLASLGLESDEAWLPTIDALEDDLLVTTTRRAADVVAVESHPLIREFFDDQLRDGKLSHSYKRAHKVLLEHLAAGTHEPERPGLADLQPLYEAVMHGCRAGEAQRAYQEVLHARIFKGSIVRAHSWITLGAVETDLAALANFFGPRFQGVDPRLQPIQKGEVLVLTGFLLCISSRLTDGLALLRQAEGHEMSIENWPAVVRAKALLATYELVFGNVGKCTRYARDAIEMAVKCPLHPETLNWMIRCWAALGDAAHQAGNAEDSVNHFYQFQKLLQAHRAQLGNPALIGLTQLCDFKIAPLEAKAWKQFFAPEHAGIDLERARAVKAETDTVARLGLEHALKHEMHSIKGFCQLTLLRTKAFMTVIESKDGRAAQERFVVEEHDERARADIDQIIDTLRAGYQRQFLIRGLLTRSAIRFMQGRYFGSNSAVSDLDEAFEIAKWGPMQLHKADVHLNRARFFGLADECKGTRYPWVSPAIDLAEARQIIELCHYGRRLDDLAEAMRLLADRSAEAA
jgi:hypothetical protein